MTNDITMANQRPVPGGTHRELAAAPRRGQTVNARTPRRRAGAWLQALAAILVAAFVAGRTLAVYDPADFNTLDDVYGYLDELDAISAGIGGGQVLPIGTSIQGRTMKAFKIGAGAPSIVITSNLSANQWMSTSAVTNLAGKLVNEDGSDPGITQLLDTYTLYLVPIANPDGYDYTWTNDASWTRNDPGNDCGAVALDRNWSVGWDGSNTDPCSSDYPGPAPMSAPEVGALADYIAGLPNVVLHVDLVGRSITGEGPELGQWIASPWGSGTCAPPDAAVLTQLGAAFEAGAVGVHGQAYPPIELRAAYAAAGEGEASGSFIDWTYGAQGVLSFQVRSDRAHVPPQIQPLVDEFCAGLQALIGQYAGQSGTPGVSPCPDEPTSPYEPGGTTEIVTLPSPGGGLTCSAAGKEKGKVSWVNPPMKNARVAPPVTTGHGVFGFSGAYTVAMMDLSPSAVSQDVNSQRTYRSDVGPDTAIGNGWDYSYNLRMEEDGGGNIVLHKGNGRQDTYPPSATDTWSRSEFFDVVTRDPADDSYTVTFADTGTWRFAAPASPLAGTAPSGCPADLDGNGEVGFADLTALLSQWGPCPGCSADLDGNGEVGFSDLTTLLATWGPCPITASPGAVLGFGDRNGNALDFAYDEQGRLIQIIDDLGRATDIAYDADGMIETVTDFAGREVRYAYYQDGDADGSAGDLKSVTMPAVIGTSNGNDYPQGKTTTYMYTKGFADDRLNHMLVTTTDPKGQTYLTNVYAHTIDAGDFRYTEDPNDFYFGRVVRQILGDPGDILDFVYVPVTPDVSNGQAITKTIVNDREGNVTESFYDAGNRKVMERRYTGRAPDADAATTESANRPVSPLRAGDPAYFETRWEYNADALVTRIVHPNGNEETFVYDETNASRRSQGNLLQHCELPGVLGGDQTQLCETFEYDDDFGAGCCGTNFVTRHVDARGSETLHEYDAAGNRTHTQHRIPSLVEDYEYNARGQMTAHVHPDNGSSHRRRDEYVYYGSGPQTGYLQQSIVDAGGFDLTTSYEYDAVGNVIQTTDPRGNDTQYEVNALNQVVRELSRPVDGGGTRYETLFWYDPNDNLVRTDVENRDALGALQANSHFTTIAEYDILDNVLRTCQESGNYVGTIPGTSQEPTCAGLPDAEFITTEFVYDANRNRTLVRSGEAVNGTQPTNVVRTLYDERDLTYQVIRAEGDANQSSTQFDFDGNGNMNRLSSGLEDTPRITTSQYDGYDRLVRTTDPLGNVTESSYDANSNVVVARAFGELADVAGQVGNVRLSETTLVYDAMDRQIREEVAFFDTATQGDVGDGLAVTEIEYTDTSQVKLTRNDNGHATTTVYDTANRAATVTSVKGDTIASVYDANSNVLTMTETEISDLGPVSVFTTTMAYDGLDRMISTTDNVGNVNQIAYDSRGNQTVTIDALGNIVRHAYDGVNRRVATTHELTDTGDGTGMLIDTIVTTQSWDDNSRLITQGDDNANLTTHQYDALNRQTAEICADGTSKTFIYDVYDNRVTTSDANGTIVTSAYDLNDRLTAKIITPGGGVSNDTTFEQFAYDGLSRMITAVDDDSTVLRSYDSMSNIVSETLNGQTTACVYDGVGNMTQCTYPGGRTVTRTFDALEQTSTISDAAGGIAAYAYDGPGRVGLRNYGNGTRSGYVYDGITGTPNAPGDFGVKKLVRTIHQRISNGFILEDRSFTWDRVGNKTQRADLAGAGDVYDYTYDSAYRMTRSVKTPPGGALGELAYQLDGVGNRQTVTGRTDPGSYSMDAALPPSDFQMNQYTATPLEVTRQYDDNGNLVAFGGTATATYDYRNQMVAYDDVPNGVQATYAYDVLGRRIERTVGGQTTRYFYDGWQVVEEQDDVGVTAATYVYGIYIDEVLNMQRGGVDYYYHTDDLYDVMAVTNGTGATVERYEYDDYGQVEFRNAFGSPIAASAIDNPYLFTGRRFDTESDLYYYRTRYMDPAVGRFTTRDTIGIWGDAANLGNGYAYVGNRPWTSLDPAGQVETASGGGRCIKRCWKEGERCLARASSSTERQWCISAKDWCAFQCVNSRHGWSAMAFGGGNGTGREPTNLAGTIQTTGRQVGVPAIVVFMNDAVARKARRRHRRPAAAQASGCSVAMSLSSSYHGRTKALQKTINRYYGARVTGGGQPSVGGQGGSTGPSAVRDTSISDCKQSWPEGRYRRCMKRAKETLNRRFGA